MAKKLIHFAGFKFLPNLNPEEMFLIGCHGGAFFQHCKLNTQLTYAKDRGRTSKTYDTNLNYFEVYPARINNWSDIRLRSRKIKDLTKEFLEWYIGFYSGDRGIDDENWTMIHKRCTQEARGLMNKALGEGDRKTAKQYGQLLIELAVNPGFEETL